MTYRTAIALGSNLGDRLSTLRQAVRRLRDVGEVAAVSSLYETAPVGGPEQPSYLNAVAVVATQLEPADLLERLQELEGAAGRIREERWGPRTLDLDIVAIERDGEPVRSATETLSVPHPRAAERRFVLEPLAEVWPEVRIAPELTVTEALELVEDQDVDRLGGDWLERKVGPAVTLVVAQFVLFSALTLVVIATGSPSTVSLLVGGVLVVAGSAVALWAVATLGDALTPLPEPRPGTVIVTGGPYRLVRHPIYSGIILALVGVALAFRSWLALATAVVAGAFFWIKARYEESRLRVAVPGYSRYLRKVRGRLVPLPSRGGRATLEGDG